MQRLSKTDFQKKVKKTGKFREPLLFIAFNHKQDIAVSNCNVYGYRSSSLKLLSYAQKNLKKLDAFGIIKQNIRYLHFVRGDI